MCDWKTERSGLHRLPKGGDAAGTDGGLHLDYSPPATKEQPSVQEPHALVRTEMIGIGGQAVMIFYGKDSGRIVGWIAKGL